MSVTLSIWNIIVLLNFKLSVNISECRFTEKLLKFLTINSSILYSYTMGMSALPNINTLTYRCISPNRWGESCKTTATLIKARFLTSFVGDRDECCGAFELPMQSGTL